MISITPAKSIATTLLFISLLQSSALLAADEFDSVDLKLEPVTLVTWEEIDDAFRYRFTLNDEEIGTSLGGSRYFAHPGPFDEVVIRGETFDGDDTGQTELISTEDAERLVLRWDEQAFDRPFVGLRTDSSRMAMELTEMPYVIGTDPENIQIMLFGDEADRPNRRQPGAPFEFDGDDILEHGPLIELPLP